MIQAKDLPRAHAAPMPPGTTDESDNAEDVRLVYLRSHRLIRLIDECGKKPLVLFATTERHTTQFVWS